MGARRAMGWLRRGATTRQFLVSFAAGLAAMGIVNALRWLREPVVGRPTLEA